MSSIKNAASAFVLLSAFALSGAGAVALAATPSTAAPAKPAASTTAKPTAGAPAKPVAGAPAMTPDQKAMIAHVDAHLAMLKKSIAITTGEQPAWHGFTQVSRRNALNLAGLYQARAKALPTMNAVQNMESYAAISAKNADDMNALSAAFQTLYTQLTPAQQKKIDAQFRARAKAMTARHLKRMKHK